MADDKPGELIGLRLRAARGRMTVPELSKLSGVPDLTIRRYERGERDNPDLKIIGLLTKALGVQMDSIIHLDDYLPEGTPAEMALAAN